MIVFAAGVPGLAAATDVKLFLDVVVNGYPSHKIGVFVQRGQELFARPDELRSLGFPLPASLPLGPDGLVALSALPDFSARLDQPTQTLLITAETHRLRPELLRIGSTAEQGIPVQSGAGVTFDYDISATSTSGQNVGGGQFDLRAFSPYGVVSSGWLAFYGPRSYSIPSTLRLDTTYTYSDPDTLRRWRLGDIIANGPGWVRPVRLGGFQLTSDFSMRPDLVTFPLPALSGSVTVPSTVDVMLNGTRLLSQQVQPGPFQIPQIPVVTGAGEVTMTVTNALGQQVVTTLPFYGSQGLLAPGLQSYSAQAGWVRRNWGLLSTDYGAFAASGSWRRGLSDSVTVETHAEGAAGLLMVGGGAVVKVGNLGVANCSLAGSTGSGQRGGQLSIGMQRLGRRFSLGAAATVASRGFRDIASMHGDPVPRRQISANAGLSLDEYGSLGIAYTESYPSPATRIRTLSASYSVRLHDMALYATGFHADASGGNGVMIGVTIPLGARSSASTSVGSSSGGGRTQLQAMQSAVSVGDWGYQVYGVTGTPSHQFGQVQYKSPWALLTAGADHLAGQTTLRAEAQGALSLIDGDLFASNTINDSFAVVDTNGIGHIRVFNENREVGRTDPDGKLLVPDLRSFDINNLAIEPKDVPLDATVPFFAREVRPQDRSGVVVEFPVKRSHGALLRLIDASGRPIRVGSVATLDATGAAVPVGYGGEAYLQGLKPRNRVSVVEPDGRRCAAAFAYRPQPGEIPAIGPVVCQEEEQ
ncbi:MAG: fimbrial biogenesis outer membrane usher protein [Stenotrophomonas sp.]|nr:fimbrial biogenesis outer membrane usher protein [Stenotrophomonas sp.]